MYVCQLISSSKDCTTAETATDKKRKLHTELAHLAPFFGVNNFWSESVHFAVSHQFFEIWNLETSPVPFASSGCLKLENLVGCFCR